MLKFGKDQNLSIRLADKEHTLTRQFIVALMIALAIHIGAIVMFHIQPLITKESKFISPPVNASADIAKFLMSASQTGSALEQRRQKKIPDLPRQQPEDPINRPFTSSPFITPPTMDARYLFEDYPVQWEPSP